MPHTEETESQLWRTPDAHSDRGASSHERAKLKIEQGMPISINDMVAHPDLFPTPVVADSAQGAVIGENDTFRETSSGRLRKVNQYGTDGSIGLGRYVQMFPTPRANECGDYQYSQGDHAKPTLTLSGVAKLWPTPKAIIRGDCQSERNRHTPDLAAAVIMYPTPTTPRPHDTESTVGRYIQSQNQKDLTFAVAQQGGQLNPDWVEWLMGLPIGWTDRNRDAAKPEPLNGWWPDEPDHIPRVASGILNRVDRLKCLGNMVVPQQFYPIFQAIADIERANKK